MIKEIITVKQNGDKLEIRRYDDVSPLGTCVLIGLVILGALFWLPLWVM